MSDLPLWVAIGGFAIPLLGLAGSAIAYVVKLFQDARERRHARFFELMNFLDGEGTIAAKLAAIYALRNFPEHRAFIIRFCETQHNNIDGPGHVVQSLRDEFLRTAKALR